MIVMNDCRTVLGERAAYQFAHIGHRMNGRAEVVVQVTPYDHHLRPHYLSCRRAPGAGWQVLAGERAVLVDAIRAAEQETRPAVTTSPELVELLAMAEGVRDGAR